jgi:hypothetical protein
MSDILAGGPDAHCGASASHRRSDLMAASKSKPPPSNLPPEQRPSGSLPAERRRPRAEQRTTQSRRDKTRPEKHM